MTPSEANERMRAAMAAWPTRPGPDVVERMAKALERHDEFAAASEAALRGVTYHLGASARDAAEREGRAWWSAG